MTTKSVDLPHLRSVVLAGHAGAGKTTLAERCSTGPGRYRAWAASRTARPRWTTSPRSRSGTCRSRSASPRSTTRATSSRSWTLPATPTSRPRSSSASRPSTPRSICVDASGGVEAGTEIAVGAWPRRNGTAALFVVNKCDRENADPAAVLDALRAAFGNKIAPLQLAIGKADTFAGYVDLVHRKAYRWDGKQEVEIAIPAELEAEVAMRRDQLLEAASEADDDVLTKYLEGEEISDAELDACLHRGVRDSILAPVLVGQRTKGIGLEASSTRSSATCPRPPRSRRSTAREPKSGDPVEVPPAADGPLLVRVFKTTADPFVGRLTYLRVLSGTLRSQGHAWNAEKGEDERIGQLLRLHGKEQEPVGELRAGEIGAVAKLP